MIKVELTEDEAKYILLLTSLDAMRIDKMQSIIEKDISYTIRHGVRAKLIPGVYGDKTNDKTSNS